MRPTIGSAPGGGAGVSASPIELVEERRAPGAVQLDDAKTMRPMPMPKTSARPGACSSTRRNKSVASARRRRCRGRRQEADCAHEQARVEDADAAPAEARRPARRVAVRLLDIGERLHGAPRRLGRPGRRRAGRAAGGRPVWSASLCKPPTTPRGSCGSSGARHRARWPQPGSRRPRGRRIRRARQSRATTSVLCHKGQCSMGRTSEKRGILSRPLRVQSQMAYGPPVVRAFASCGARGVLLRGSRRCAMPTTAGASCTSATA